MVGGALDRYFKTKDINAGLYDPPKGLNDTSVLAEADVIFVAVPTPYYLDGTGFDDSFMRAAMDAIPTPGKVIVFKSTIVPGTTERFQEMYPQHRVMFNPEFLTEANADKDMVFPDRQILGTTSQSEKDAALILSLLPRAPYEKVMSARNAELVKYFGNAFLAMKVTYANHMYDVCQSIGCDYDEVKEGASADPRIGKSHLDVGHGGYRGYGGKCLPKDVRSLVQFASALGVDIPLIVAAEKYNNELVGKQGLDIKWKEGSPDKK